MKHSVVLSKAQQAEHDRLTRWHLFVHEHELDRERALNAEREENARLKRIAGLKPQVMRASA